MRPKGYYSVNCENGSVMIWGGIDAQLCLILINFYSFWNLMTIL